MGKESYEGWIFNGKEDWGLKYPDISGKDEEKNPEPKKKVLEDFIPGAPTKRDRAEAHLILNALATPPLGRGLTDSELAFLYVLDEAPRREIIGMVLEAASRLYCQTKIIQATQEMLLRDCLLIQHFYYPISDPNLEPLDSAYSAQTKSFVSTCTPALDMLARLEIKSASARKVMKALKQYRDSAPFRDKAYRRLIGIYIENQRSIPSLPRTQPK